MKDREEYISILEQENAELKKRLKNKSEELELVRCDLHNRASERNGYEREIETLKNQQKEFIRFLEDEITKLEKVQVSLLEEITGKDYLIKVKKEILSKYKEIIEETNEKQM